MANYKPVKIMFNIEDPHQAKLYEYLKSHSNSSSFIRALLHHDMYKDNESDDIEIVEYKSKPKPDVHMEVNTKPLKVNITKMPKEEDIILDGII